MKRFPFGLALGAILFNAGIYIFLQPGYLTPDGIGYAAYLPTIFGQRTLSFLPFFNAHPMGLPVARTLTGYAANLWPFGLSFLGLPFYETTRWLLATAGHSALWGPLYQGVLNLAGMLLGGAAALLLMDALPRTLRRTERLLLAVLCFFGTPLFFYSFCIGSTAHAVSAFTSGLMVWFWLKTARLPDNQQNCGERWLTLGLLAGIAAMVRSQEALILIAPFWEWLRRSRASEESPRWTALGFLGLGFSIGFAPQALLWHFLYGHAWNSPQLFNIALSNFALGKSLFSSYHGLFTWTPLYLLAILGLANAARKGRWEARPLIAILGIQILMNGFYVAWWDMLSFSLRLLTGTFLIAGLGVGWLMETSRRWLWPVVFFCAAWSLVLAMHGYAGTLDLRAFYPWRLLWPVLCQPHALVLGLRQEIWRYGKIPPAVIPVCLGMEFVTGAWLLALLWSARSKVGTTTSRILLLTFAPWILYAVMQIYRAHKAPKPSWGNASVLSVADLGNIFIADSFEGKAFYWLARGDVQRSLNAIEQAQRRLPPSSATENFRVEYAQTRLRIDRANSRR